MSRKYQPPKRTGKEYVTAAIEFNAYTIDRCMKLPGEWNEYVLAPLVKDTNQIESFVVTANKVYISKEMQSKEELIQSLNQRDEYLSKALRLFNDFNIKFDRLMGMVDIVGYEKQRLKNEMYNLIDEMRKDHPELNNIKINMITHKDEMEYSALNGSVHQKLALNSKNRDHWLFLEKEAEKEIGSRLSLDKKVIKEAKVS